MTFSVWCDCGQTFEGVGADAGSRVRCPFCGRELTLPGPEPRLDEYFAAWDPRPSTSGNAIASLVLGLFLPLACLSGLPAILLGRRALSDIARSGGRLRGRGMAIGGVVLGVIGCFVAVAYLLPVVRHPPDASRRAQCTNNLKQIGLALENYCATYGVLPPAAITDREGRPVLSWRVAILPFLECNSTYAKFHLDEPWDSPHNLALLAERPFAYACPAHEGLKPGMTSYQVVLGPETAFTPDFKPLKMEDITDGTTVTILVSESLRTVPWTKPEDLPFDMRVPLSGLGSHHGYDNNGFNALFADGSVRFLKSSIAPGILEALITRNRDDLILEQDEY